MKTLFAVLIAATFAGLSVTRAEAQPAASGAAAAKPKAIAVHVEGTEVEAIRAAIAGALPDRLRVIDAATFDDALGKQGQRGPIGAVVSQQKPRERALAKVRKAMAAVGADAVIVARGRREAGKLVVRVLWVDALGGDLAVDEDVALGGDADAKKVAIAKPLRAAIDSISPPPPPSSTQQREDTAPAAPPPPPPAPARLSGHVPTAIVIAAIGFELGGRWFRYSDGISQNLRPYSVFGAPMPAFSIEVYPLAGLDAPIARDLGLTAAYAHAFGLSSATASSGDIKTSWDRLRTGLRYRLRPSDLPFRGASPEDAAGSAMIGIEGGFGLDRFAFSTTGALANEVPSAFYKFLHVGLDATIPASRAAFMLHARYLGALSSGEVYARFRNAKLGGVDLGGGLAVRLAAGFEIRVTADYERWFSSFDPVPGDPYVAGGALDEMVSLHLGAAYAY